MGGTASRQRRASPSGLRVNWDSNLAGPRREVQEAPGETAAGLLP